MRDLVAFSVVLVATEDHGGGAGADRAVVPDRRDHGHRRDVDAHRPARDQLHSAHRRWIHHHSGGQPGATNVTGNFTVGSVSGASSTRVSFESRTIPITAGALRDTFTGVSRHVYVLQ